MTQTKKQDNTGPDIEISTPHLIWKGLDFNAEMVACDCINAALTCIALPANLKNVPFEVSIVLASDRMVQTLNNQYRDIDSPTNVLSFPAHDPDGPPQPDESYLLGDIILSYETILQESEEQEKNLKHHFSHLVIHGFLHLLGYDHEEDKDAKVMEKLEIKILSTMGLKNPYE